MLKNYYANVGIDMVSLDMIWLSIWYSYGYTWTLIRATWAFHGMLLN